jgi:hypothetical protein
VATFYLFQTEQDRFSLQSLIKVMCNNCTEGNDLIRRSLQIKADMYFCLELDAGPDAHAPSFSHIH